VIYAPGRRHARQNGTFVNDINQPIAFRFQFYDMREMRQFGVFPVRKIRIPPFCGGYKNGPDIGVDMQASACKQQNDYSKLPRLFPFPAKIPHGADTDNVASYCVTDIESEPYSVPVNDQLAPPSGAVT
jgi:hypothetical protein